MIDYIRFKLKKIYEYRKHDFLTSVVYIYSVYTLTHELMHVKSRGKKKTETKIKPLVLKYS